MWVLTLISATASAIAQRADPDAAIRRDYDTGQQAMRSGNLSAAEKAFLEILAIAPRDAGAHANLGVVYMRQKKWKPALEQLRAAERLAPQVPGIRLNIGLAYYRQGEYANAIPPFESVVRDQPESSQARRLLGLCYFFEQRYKEATGALADLWSGSNNDFSYLYVLSVAAGNAGRHDLEQRALTRLLEVGKNSPELHLVLGKAYLARDQDDSAMAELRRAAQAAPKLPFVHYNLGVVYRRKGEFAKAKEEFLKDAAIEPDVAYNYEQLGIVSQSLGQNAEAERYFQSALKLDRRLGTSWYGLAKMYKEEKKYTAALNALDEAGSLDSKSPSVHYLRAQVLTALGRAASARAELETVRSLQRQTAGKLEQEISGGEYRDPQLTVEQQR